MRVRENAESIAMFNGGQREMLGARHLLGLLIQNNYQVIWAMFGFEMFQNGTQYLTGLLPALLVAPQYLAGEVEFGKVKQAQDAFMMLRFSLFVIANRTDEFSAFATGLGRLEALMSAINDADEDEVHSSEEASEQDMLLSQGTHEMSKLGQGFDHGGLSLTSLSVSIPRTSRRCVLCVCVCSLVLLQCVGARACLFAFVLAHVILCMCWCAFVRARSCAPVCVFPWTLACGVRCACSFACV